jgi:hypothetical protein
MTSSVRNPKGAETECSFTDGSSILVSSYCIASGLPLWRSWTVEPAK